MDKEKIIEKQQEIIRLAKSFCNEKINEEYATLAEKLICKLGRKRDVPFVTGQTAVWAAVVIHALGTINSLFYESTNPYVSVEEINDFFGTEASTTSNKSKEIRTLLKLKHGDKEFSTKSVSEFSPLADLYLAMLEKQLASDSSLSKKDREKAMEEFAAASGISYRAKK